MGRAGQFGQLHHQQTDGAAAHHTDLVPHLDARQVDAVEAAGQGLGHGGSLPGDGGLQLKGLGRGDAAVLGKAAVPGDADGLHGGAQLLFAVLAIRAVAAVDVGVYGDVVAHREAGDALPHLHHFAGVLMAQHHRRVHVGGARLPVVDVHIGAADAAHLVAQHQLPRPSVGRGQIGDGEGLIPEKTGRFHRNSSHPKVLGTIFAPKRALVKRETKRAATLFVAALCLDGITFSARQWHR